MTIWIFAGSTGGHISPGLALADSFIDKKDAVSFFTLKRNLNYPPIQRFAQQIKEIQKTIKPHNRNKIEIIEYSARPIPRGIFSMVQFVGSMVRSFYIFIKKNREQKPDVILCMGGYPCFPPILWAILAKIRYYLCEQNAVLGRVNRYFASRAKGVLLSFPMQDMPKKFYFVGNPIRKEVRFEKPAHPKQPSKAGSERSKPESILLLGGSQGAQDINQLYLAMKEHPFFDSICLTISTGANHYDSMSPLVRKQDQIFPFIKDIKTAFDQADCIIGRAGSSTIFEILSARKPAIYLPYPYAVYNHQSKNAEALVKLGLAGLVDVRPFDANIAMKKILNLLRNTFSDMQKNLTNHQIPLNAHHRIALRVSIDHSDQCNFSTSGTVRA